jgi:DNA polymerase/3'-5' exonuclease PolX
MSDGVKMPLSRAQGIADRFIKLIDPVSLLLSVAGSVRRQVALVGDIEIVAVPGDEFSFEKLFPEGYPGLVVNGSRLKRFIYPDSKVQIELYITSKYDYGRILAIRTGSSAYSHSQIAINWNRLGWCGTVDGLRRKRECDHKGNVWKIKPEYKLNPTKPPDFETEEAFFEFLGIPWVDPRERSWISNDPVNNYKL